jgi:hypothetical protein
LTSPDGRENLVAGLPSERGKNEHTPHWTISPEQFNEINQRISSLHLHPFFRPSVLTADGRPASFSVSDKTNLVEFDCVPYVADKGLKNGHQGIALVFRTKTIGSPTGSEQELVGTNQYKASGEVGVEDRGGFIVSTGNPEGSASNVVMVFRVEMVTNASSAHLGRQQIIKELERIRLDHFGPIRQPLPQVLRDLQDQITGLVSHDSGIHFLFTDKPDNRLPMINPNTGLPLDEARTNGVDMNSVLVSIDPPLKNVTLADILDAIITHVNKPMEYTVLDWGILFSPNNPQASRLFSRTFRVDTNVFLAHLKEQTGVQTNVAFVLKQLFSKAGVKLVPPKAVFYNDRLGLVFVRATQHDLDVVENIIARLDNTPQGIHIKARFIEVPGRVAADVRLGSFNANNHLALDNIPQPNRNTLNQPEFTVTAAEPASFTSIMTESQFQAALHTLRGSTGFKELAAPEVTTLSGRQTEMRATIIQTIITNFAVEETSNNIAVTPQEMKLGTGPIFNVIPKVLPDGYTIDLETTASRVEFLGYADPTNFTNFATNSAGEKFSLPVILPAVETKRASAHLKLYDGQTLVLSGFQPEQVLFSKPEKKREERVAGHIQQAEKQYGNKALIVLATITLVDSAGNRIHSDADLPFAQNGIPPQNGP